MPATIPLFFVGNQLTTFSLTPQTVSLSTGVLTDGTVTSFLGKWDEIDVEYDVESEEVSASDALQQNTMILKNISKMRCTTLMESVTGGNQLTALLRASDYFKMILTRAGKSHTVYIQRGRLTESVRKGKSTISAEFNPIDAGASFPSYA